MSLDDTKCGRIFEALKNDILGGKYRFGQPVPSVRALARRHGVSVNTVRRAFGELAHLGFIAGRQGSGMFVTRSGASRKIGLIVPGMCYSEVFPPICRELSRMAQEGGYALLFGDLTSDDPVARGRRAKELARQYVDEGVSGVVFQPLEFLEDSDALNGEILSAFDCAGIAVVLLDCDIVASPERSAYDVVGIDNTDAGRRLARHLRDCGARHVAFLADVHSDCSVRNRIEGARRVGGRFSESACDPSDADAVRRLLARKPKVDAVICRNDHEAAHLLVTLRKLGKRVPKDIRVAAFNDVAYASILEPALTTVHLPCEDIARQAFSFLCERIARPSLPPRECYLYAPLVVRGSSRGFSKPLLSESVRTHPSFR